MPHETVWEAGDRQKDGTDSLGLVSASGLLSARADIACLSSSLPCRRLFQYFSSFDLEFAFT